MIGTIYINFWSALIGFCIYFFARFLTNQSPTSIIIYSFLFALAFFLITFVVRALLALILYNPPNEEPETQQAVEQTTVELDTPSEGQSEEIAQVVKTMLAKDE